MLYGDYSDVKKSKSQMSKFPSPNKLVFQSTSCVSKQTNPVPIKISALLNTLSIVART